MYGVASLCFSSERRGLSVHAQHAAGEVHASTQNLLEPNTDMVSGICERYRGILCTPPWMSLPVVAVPSKKRMLTRKALAIDSCDNHEKKACVICDVLTHCRHA